MNEFEEELANYHKKELLFKKQVGRSNKCPKCRRRGCFGSITRIYTGVSVLMICGWCDNIKELPLEDWNKKLKLSKKELKQS